MDSSISGSMNVMTTSKQGGICWLKSLLLEQNNHISTSVFSNTLSIIS